MADYVQIVTTFPNRSEAEGVASELVDRRLVACVQIDGPITSVYTWQGKTENAEEWRLTLKTRLDRFAAIETAIRELHSYDTPEILATPIVAGNEKYLRWIDDALKS